MRQKAQIIADVCSELLAGKTAQARAIACREYPFVAAEASKRRMTDAQRTRVFIRDGFLDRYSGDKLVYPGAIILLSLLMPEEFPAHPSWKMDESHIFYWELWPTIDHVIPVSRGGKDEESNWVCTSMMRNSAKSNWLLEEIGWQKLDPGDFREWDGLLHWFLDYLKAHPLWLENKEVKKWHATAQRCLPLPITETVG